VLRFKQWMRIPKLKSKSQSLRALEVLQSKPADLNLLDSLVVTTTRMKVQEVVAEVEVEETERQKRKVHVQTKRL